MSTECILCGYGVTSPTLEHMTPIARGGKPRDRRNIAVACRECNSAKADMTIDEFQFFVETGSFSDSYCRYLAEKASGRLPLRLIDRRKTA
jgi:hypothetical protein